MTNELDMVPKLVNIPEGIDHTTTAGALKLMSHLYPKDFRYAQNGTIYELRWSSQDPPFPVPDGHVPQRIAMRLVETLEEKEVEKPVKKTAKKPAKKQDKKVVEEEPLGESDEAPPEEHLVEDE